MVCYSEALLTAVLRKDIIIADDLYCNLLVNWPGLQVYSVADVLIVSCTRLKERRIFSRKMFPCSNASFTWSDRNFCGISLLEFVSKRLVLKRPVTVDYPKSCALTVFGSLMGLSQLIPLFWRYPIVSNIGLVRHSDVLTTTISDHFLVDCTLCLKIPIPKPSVITTRSCKNFDQETFNADISKVPGTHPVSLILSKIKWNVSISCSWKC